MKKATLILAAAASLWAGSASAMTVQEFLTSANRIPRNPTALLRSDTRRLMNEINGAFKTVGDEQEAAQAAGRRPATCIAKGTKKTLATSPTFGTMLVCGLSKPITGETL